MTEGKRKQGILFTVSDDLEERVGASSDVDASFDPRLHGDCCLCATADKSAVACAVAVVEAVGIEGAGVCEGEGLIEGEGGLAALFDGVGDVE